MGAKIIINKKGTRLRGSLFTVYFNGKEVATMIDKKIFFVEEAGVYAIQLKTPWLKTKTLIVKAEEGEEVNLVVRNGLKYYSVVYLLFFISLFSVLLLQTLKIGRPEWMLIAQTIFYAGITLYVLFYFIFKRGEIWILEDANANNKSR